MLKTAQKILAKIPKVTYADVRIVEKESEDIATKDGVVEALASSTSIGYGIRVLKNGAWGFAASNIITTKEIDRTIKKAVAIAESSAQYKAENVLLDHLKAIQAKYKTNVTEDPFTVPLTEKIALLLAADKAQRVNSKIVISQAFFQANKERKYFASTIGSLIDQEIIWTGAGLETSAANSNDFQNRSYPNSFRGQNQTRGFELVRELQLAKHAPQVGKEAVDLLTAPICPSGEMDLILDSNQLALQIHESCGHAVELDRVLGYEASYAGTSFLTPEKLGSFKYGSDIVNLTADATIPGGLGTFAYDDEGVPAKRTYLVKNGVFVDYITSRETVAQLKKAVSSYNKPSNGTMRASSWNRLPLIRMTNINLEPGTWRLEDLIADTKKGIFMSTNRSWSIDDKRLNFQFGTEIAWEIKNGKKGRMFKNPTYQGMTPQFWGSCDAICNRDHWVVWGTPNCGKGQPSQVMYTGHGTSPARFRKVKVGVVKW
ncbi:peptidase C69 [Candidatus Roizmanbacteria bacterium RIFCSPHIGHO2_12_FULL_41_11]|uniref:Peptidase C69 n=2 Tax=Candidatus Roizmaniibacteriota TaxID=1752723 RepID=A0A1F7J5W8_9BACT|nr:MAG: peptidase C69 [Candidatus Roizmanbacteria bacterium RIFCSPHIGHO2_12_FULL_41_11]OGK50997.1 MAG: peptidase C69 [Candidatus Roizmanbacteria bacterium RIFCSPLOWO2_01_FULL_41_22]